MLNTSSIHQFLPKMHLRLKNRPHCQRNMHPLVIRHINDSPPSILNLLPPITYLIFIEVIHPLADWCLFGDKLLSWSREIRLFYVIIFGNRGNCSRISLILKRIHPKASQYKFSSFLYEGLSKIHDFLWALPIQKLKWQDIYLKD